MRAISVKVNDVIGVAGFVAPGTSVDVVVTVRTGSEGSMSRVVVSNVQVLTVGTRSDQQSANVRDSQRSPSSVVTLMVTPDDAERIALAGAEGQIILTLRNPLDTVPTTTEGTRMASLMGKAASPPPVVRKAAASTKVVAAPPPPKVEEPVSKLYEVEAIRAAKRTEEIVR
jgi:pilus assembly protein CpaB